MDKPLYKYSLVLFASQGIAACLIAGTGLLIARILSVAEFGIFSAALAFAQMLAMMVDSGMGQLAAKIIARGVLRWLLS